MSNLNVEKFLARTYLDVQHLRVAIDLRMQKAQQVTSETDELERLISQFKGMEKGILKQIVEKNKNSELYAWCKATKGLGDVAFTTFLGFIDPQYATTVGKIYAWLGLVPKAQLANKGQKFNHEIKGRIWLLARNVIMAKDPYYYPLYKQKKEYLTTRPDLDKTAKGYKGHIDNLAKRWLMKILISHAWEILRKAEGLTINPHQGYIGPKPY